jgi:hypothetical protein
VVWAEPIWSFSGVTVEVPAISDNLYGGGPK